MGKKQRRRVASGVVQDIGDAPVAGPRKPCPCGSGKRFKLCHGRREQGSDAALVRRPFAGLTGECDLVAMREVVPAATAAVRTTGEYGAEDVTVATVLPMAWPALRRADGRVLVGLQVHGVSGDASRDVAAALLRSLDGAPGEPVTESGLPGPGPRLQDVLDTSLPFEVAVHSGFDFWLDEGAEHSDDRSPDVEASLERANAAAVPTERLAGVEAAYWCRIGEREHLRWVLPHDEDALLDALARLHARGASSLGDGSRYIGAFRAHGLLIPVWDLSPGTPVDAVEEPAAAFASRLDEALAETSPLTVDERRARAGVVSRQLTLR